MERQHDRPVRAGGVLATSKFSVEHTAYRVAGQVLQDGIDDEPVRSGRSRFAGARRDIDQAPPLTQPTEPGPYSRITTSSCRWDPTSPPIP